MGGICIGSSGVTLAHGMEHPVSGLRNIVHGQGLAALTPAVTAFMTGRLKAALAGSGCRGESRLAADKFSCISRLLGGEGLSDCACHIRALLASLDLTPSLGALGISAADIPWLVENCRKVSAGNLMNTPLPVKEEDMAAIYARAIAGEEEPC